MESCLSAYHELDRPIRVRNAMLCLGVRKGRRSGEGLSQTRAGVEPMTAQLMTERRHDVAKPTKTQLSAAGKALSNPHTREVNETKAAKTLAAGRKAK